MSNHTALIIDDEPDIRELLGMTLTRIGIDSVDVSDITSAKEILEHKVFDICLTDMRLPDGNGVEFVSYAQEHYPDMPIAVITAHGNMESAIQALKSGAFDFLTKPVELDSLKALILNAVRLSGNDQEIVRKQLVGESVAIQALKRKITKLARSQAPVYISGESGVGKELVAKIIHASGSRASKAFIPVNCGAIPGELIESEFFGHAKGSFTGAISDKEGFFQAADGGTLFLDEVAELPFNMQVKLLRVVQEKAVRPVGKQQEISVDVRILCATHKDLSALVTVGEFRQDLYYRINVIELHVPALRERTGDISLLTKYFVERIAERFEIAAPAFSQAAHQVLNKYHFPGNVRELENILERAITLSDGEIIEEHNLQLTDIKLNTPDMIKAVKGEKITLDTYLIDVEKQVILNALEDARWNKTKAAKLLGISFRALRYRLQKLNIE